MPTINLAALYAGTIEFSIHKFIYIYANLLILFDISVCNRFSRINNQIRAIVHYYLLLHVNDTRSIQMRQCTTD